MAVWCLSLSYRLYCSLRVSGTVHYKRNTRRETRRTSTQQLRPHSDSSEPRPPHRLCPSWTVEEPWRTSRHTKRMSTTRQRSSFDSEWDGRREPERMQRSLESQCCKCPCLVADWQTSSTWFVSRWLNKQPVGPSGNPLLDRSSLPICK